jgi:hypothetical protein
VGALSGAAYSLIVYETVREASKLAAAAGGKHKSAQNLMLVRTCRMGNLPIRIHDGNNWMVQRLIQQVTLM